MWPVLPLMGSVDLLPIINTIFMVLILKGIEKVGTSIHKHQNP